MAAVPYIGRFAELVAVVAVVVVVAAAAAVVEGGDAVCAVAAAVAGFEFVAAESLTVGGSAGEGVVQVRVAFNFPLGHSTRCLDRLSLRACGYCKKD